MAKDAQVVRRPWCLSCIDAFLDRDAVKMTTIETGPGADTRSPLMASPRVRVRGRRPGKTGRHRHQT